MPKDKEATSQQNRSWPNLHGTAVWLLRVFSTELGTALKMTPKGVALTQLKS